MHRKWTVMIRLVAVATFVMALSGVAGSAARAGEPCCNVVAVNARTGVVTAKVNATGQEFEFKLSNPAQLKAVKVGEAIYANLATKQVSLDGQHLAGQITAIGVAPVTAAPLDGVRSTATASASAQPPQGGTPQRVNLAGGTVGSAGLHPPQLFGTKQIDPCSIPPADPADILQALLSLGMKSYFPRTMQNGGEHIKLSDPQVEQVTCPNMTMKVKLAIEYRETRGFPQFQVSGTIEMQSPLIGLVQYHPDTSGSTVVTQSNFVHATAVLTDIQITALHLNNVPNWLDNTWIRACLNGQYSNWGCTDIVHQMPFDITNLVQTYLQLGHTL